MDNLEPTSDPVKRRMESTIYYILNQIPDGERLHVGRLLVTLVDEAVSLNPVQATVTAKGGVDKAIRSSGVV